MSERTKRPLKRARTSSLTGRLRSVGAYKTRTNCAVRQTDTA